MEAWQLEQIIADKMAQPMLLLGILLAMCAGLVVLVVILYLRIQPLEQEQRTLIQLVTDLRKYLRASQDDHYGMLEDLLAESDFLITRLCKPPQAKGAVPPVTEEMPPQPKETPQATAREAPPRPDHFSPPESASFLRRHPTASSGAISAPHLADTINRYIAEGTIQNWRRHILNQHPQYQSLLHPVEPGEPLRVSQGVLQLFDDSQEKKFFAFLEEDVLHIFPNSGNISDYALKAQDFFAGYNKTAGIARVVRPAKAQKNNDGQWVIVQKGRLV